MSTNVPPSPQPYPGQPGHPGQPRPGQPYPGQPYPIPPQPKRSWFSRHKVLTVVGVVIALVVVGSALGGGRKSGSRSAASHTPAVAAPAASQEAGDADQAAAPPAADNADNAGNAGNAGNADSGIDFPGKQRDDVVGNAGDTLDDNGVQVTATPLTPGDATLGPTVCSTITIINDSKNQLDVNALDFTLQDPNGAITNVGFSGSNNHISASTLIAGGTVSGDVCFGSDVSAGGQYVLLYKPTLQLLSHRKAWVNTL